MKILLALNSFKDSCSSVAANQVFKKGLEKCVNSTDITLLPLFDGGDGSLEGLQFYFQYKKIKVPTVNALGNPIKAFYLLDAKNNIAYIEMAQASGIAQIGKKKNNILQANTFGTGILMKHAMSRKVTKIILLIGGSATNDAGIGALAALGVKFMDKQQKVLQPVPSNLLKIDTIIVPDKLSATIEVWTDVLNPFTGKEGAVAIFSKQKGASKMQQIQLERGMVHFKKRIWHQFKIDLDKIAGTGAAGGIGAGMKAILNADIRLCTPQLFKILNVEAAIQNHDLIFTGEGSIDLQSGFGKLVSGICKLSKMYHKPVIGICGNNGLNHNQATKLGFTSVLSIVRGSTSLADAIKEWKINMKNMGENAGAIVQALSVK